MDFSLYIWNSETVQYMKTPTRVPVDIAVAGMETNHNQLRLEIRVKTVS